MPSGNVADTGVWWNYAPILDVAQVEPGAHQITVRGNRNVGNNNCYFSMNYGGGFLVLA